MTELPENIAKAYGQKTADRIEMLKNFAAEFNATSGAEAQKLGIELKAEFVDFGKPRQFACSFTLNKAFVFAITTDNLFFEKPETSDLERIRQDFVTETLTRRTGELDKDVLDKLEHLL